MKKLILLTLMLIVPFFSAEKYETFGDEKGASLRILVIGENIEINNEGYHCLTDQSLNQFIETNLSDAISDFYEEYIVSGINETVSTECNTSDSGYDSGCSDFGGADSE